MLQNQALALQLVVLQLSKYVMLLGYVCFVFSPSAPAPVLCMVFKPSHATSCSVHHAEWVRVKVI